MCARGKKVSSYISLFFLKKYYLVYYYKVYGPRNALWELVDLINTPIQVDGPLVHLL